MLMILSLLVVRMGVTLGQLTLSASRMDEGAWPKVRGSTGVMLEVLPFRDVIVGCVRLLCFWKATLRSFSLGSWRDGFWKWRRKITRPWSMIFYADSESDGIAWQMARLGLRSTNRTEGRQEVEKQSKGEAGVIVWQVVGRQ
jgi:hypothetical protein